MTRPGMIRVVETKNMLGQAMPEPIATLNE